MVGVRLDMANRANISNQIKKEMKAYKEGNPRIKSKKQAMAVAYSKVKNKRRR